MSEGAFAVLAIVGLVLLVAFFVAVNYLVIRRNRRIAAEHPERVPHGKRLLLRTSPFIAIGLVATGYGIAQGDTKTIVLGVLATIGLVYEVVRRWHPPTSSTPSTTR